MSLIFKLQSTVRKAQDAQYFMYSKKYFLLNRACALVGDLFYGFLFSLLAMPVAYIIQCVMYF